MADISAVLGIFTNFMVKSKKLTDPIDQFEKLNKVAGNVATQFQKGLSGIENYVKTDARLGLMTNSLEDHVKLQDKIFISANKARTSYADMVDTVTKLGLSTGNLFKSNQEVVSFSELLQKSVVASGTSESKKPLVMQQMVDSMASGSMGSGALLSIAQNAPVIYEAISKFTGKSGNELLNMADKGELTAEKIKNSMFGMQAEIDNNFNQMPLTFTDIMNKVKNAGTDAFGSLFIAINDVVTSQGFIDFFDLIIEVIYAVGDAIDYVVSLITKYWPFIESTLMAIGVLLLVNIIAKLPVIIGYLATLLPLLLTNLATFLGLNAPIIILLVTIAAAIYLLRTMGEETMAFIGGLIGFIIALFINLFFAATQIIFRKIEYWVNLFVAFANFFANFLQDPVGSVIHLFWDLVDNVLGAIEKMATGIDFILGTNFAETIKGLRADIQVYADEKAKKYGDGTYEDKVPKLDINNLLSNVGIPMNRANYGDSWKIGENIGGEVGKSIETLLGGNPTEEGLRPSGNNKFYDSPGTRDLSNILHNKDINDTKDTTNINTNDLDAMLNSMLSANGRDFNLSPTNSRENNSNFDLSNLGNYNSYGFGINNNTPIPGTDPNSSVNVKMSEDDLAYLKEIAEQDNISKVKTNTLAPNISIQFGDVRETADVNKIVARIREILQNQIAVASEGGYYVRGVL
ncbi:tape measure protein [Anaerocolumna sp. AGMB13025]|uniref:tape measure protein n=1 Tax=Anaerocolumna sp. AGMB13025 TaxID=3039116 RepID=UPI00241D70F6|nr:tape measure protein [Anaerocolumna sp. AGMB13025]WFR57279.1 tape measure protein [Anaerocolumna sp. AGMB13025]